MVQSFNLVREERFKSYPAREVGGTIGEARVSLSPAQRDASASAGSPPVTIRCAVGVNLCPLFPHFVVDVTNFFFFDGTISSQNQNQSSVKNETKTVSQLRTRRVSR